MLEGCIWGYGNLDKLQQYILLATNQEVNLSDINRGISGDNFLGYQQQTEDINKRLNDFALCYTKKAKYPKWFIKTLCAFIPNKKCRKNLKNYIKRIKIEILKN